MSEEQASQLVNSLIRKQKDFRYIEHKMTDRGCNVVFADLPTRDMKSIADWFYSAGAIPLYVGRSWHINGFVMVAELMLP